MQIHQTSVQYVPAADRLLLRVSTHAGQQFDVWLTRRLMQRAMPVLRNVAAQQAIQQLATSGANVMPEAHDMVQEARQQRALRGADFATPFAEAPREHPLGAEPLLVVELSVTPQANQGLRVAFLDAERRHLTLDMNEQLTVALLKLLDAALARADWGLPAEPATAAAPDGAPTVLN